MDYPRFFLPTFLSPMEINLRLIPTSWISAAKLMRGFLFRGNSAGFQPLVFRHDWPPSNRSLETTSTFRRCISTMHPIRNFQVQAHAVPVCFESNETFERTTLEWFCCFHSRIWALFDENDWSWGLLSCKKVVVMIFEYEYLKDCIYF